MEVEEPQKTPHEQVAHEEPGAIEEAIRTGLSFQEVFDRYGYDKAIDTMLRPTKSTACPRGTDSAEVIQVIKTTAARGRGTESDPCRIVTQYWSLVGELLAEHDPVAQIS